jgi:hypothetical protein
MAELPRHSSRRDTQDRPLRRFSVALARGLDVAVYEVWLEAVDFGDALDHLNNLEFVELVFVMPDHANERLGEPSPTGERRVAVSTAAIAGVFDPDWLDMPQAPR